MLKSKIKRFIRKVFRSNRKGLHQNIGDNSFNYNIERFKQFLRTKANFHRQGKKPNVFIFSIPRSGSTWLQELIWTQPGFKYINEPLNLRVPYLAENLEIFNWKGLYKEQNKGQIINYLKHFCEGNYHFRDPNPIRKEHKLFTDRIVFKVLHGGEKWINEIARECNGKVIYLVRHPIAVSLSREFLPRIDVLCSDGMLNKFSDKARKMAYQVRNEGNKLEKGVLSWCIQNKIALNQYSKDWLFLTYEQLATDPEPILDNVISHCELSKPRKIYKRLSVPSAVKGKSDDKTQELLNQRGNDRYNLIEKWKKEVTDEQEERLFEIVDAFDIDVYVKGQFMPDQKYLINGK